MQKWKYVAQFTVSSLALILPGFLCANTVYNYASSSVDVSFDLTINPDSLPPGTNIDGDIVPGSFSITYPASPTDEGGFALGAGPGYESFIGPTIEIGTNSVGDITSWDITGTQFASYPAVPFESPDAFFCTYTVTFNTSGGGGPLSLDRDDDFCPPSAVSVAANGAWTPYTSPISSTPEPRNSALVGSGLLGLVALVIRRKRAAIAR